MIFKSNPAGNPFEQINVISFSRDMPPKLSGIGFVADNISKVYRKYYGKYDIVSTCMDIVPGDYANNSYNENFHFFCYGDSYNECLRNVFSMMKDLLNSKKYDVLHFHFDPMFAIPIIELSKIYKLPIVTTFHDTESIDFLSPEIALNVHRDLAGRENTVVAESIWRRLYSLGYKRLKKIPNGVDTKLFKPIESRKKYDILFFGRLSYEKGVDVIVSIIYKLIQKGVQIRGGIVGDGPFKNELEQMIISLGLEKEIDIIGSLKNSELPEIISASSLIMFPHRREGMSLTILESFSCGKVPVIPYCEYSDSVFRDCCVTVDDFLSENSFNIYQNLLGHQKEMMQIGKTAREKACKEYDWEKVTSQYYHYFSYIINNGS